MKKIVLFGGGTGLSTLLSSIKNIEAQLAIGVTTSDNGGSTGQIREHYDIPAPGDLRRVVLELSNNEKIKELYNYRFDDKLSNHTIGNLLLTALVDIEGGMQEAVKIYSDILGVDSKVYPITNDSAHLYAKMQDGERICGETEMVDSIKQIESVYYDQKIKITAEILEEIKNADMIIFACGSLYTSLLPNILHKDVIKALKESKAPKVYIANIMTQNGETNNYKLSNHIKAIEEHTYKDIVDIVIANNNFNISEEILEKYKKESSTIVELDYENLSPQIKLFADDYILVDEKIRHDTEKVKKTIEKILNER